jgi:hypothetical protein
LTALLLVSLSFNVNIPFFRAGLVLFSFPNTLILIHSFTMHLFRRTEFDGPDAVTLQDLASLRADHDSAWKEADLRKRKDNETDTTVLPHSLPSDPVSSASLHSDLSIDTATVSFHQDEDRG